MGQKYSARAVTLGMACITMLGAGTFVGVSQAQDARPAPPPAAGSPHEHGPGPDFRGGPGFVGPGFEGPRGRMHERMRGGFRGERMEPGRHIEGRIAFLKAELKITDAQGRAWDQYATYMRDTAKERQAMHEKREAEMKGRRGEPGKPPERKALLDRLNDRETIAKAMLQAVERRKAATQALYKVLNEEQKKLAEELL